MYGDWIANLTVVAATTAAVILCVLLHYEGLTFTSRKLMHLGVQRRVKVLYALGGVLLLHTVEVWIFGIAVWLLSFGAQHGHISGQATLHLFDAVYLSATTYSTVGYGDLAPVGPIRFLFGTESLVGLVLITWSASFTYLEMEKFWRSP